MTGTASPGPPLANSHAAAPINGLSGHPDDVRPSTPPLQTIDNVDSLTPKLKTPIEIIDGLSSEGSDLSELSDPPSDDDFNFLDPPLANNVNEDSKDDQDDDGDEDGDGAAPEEPDATEDGSHDVETNGHVEADDGQAEARPAKRRRVRDSTPPPSGARKVKIESPPWKKIEAEGPTSFTSDGKRRSGRINTVPIEHQHGDKRITRRALHGHQTSPVAKNRYASTNGHASTPTGSNATPNSSRRAVSGGKAPAKPTPPAKAPAKKAPTHEIKHSTRSRRQSPSPAPKTPARSSTRNRRPSRHARESLDQAGADGAAAASGQHGSATRTTPRIKLRVRAVGIPFVHPEQAKIRPKLGPNFEEYFDRAQDIPVEEGGQLASDDPPRMTDELAAHEAAIIARIEREAEDGGLLSVGRCSAYEPEPAEEPPRQWAHMDHLTKAMANFRRLMLIEQQRHRSTARKLAEACAEAWRRKQPKTAEELEEEALELWRGKYRLVVRAAFGTWENVRVEINRQRLEKWEADEQRRVKAALQEAVHKSEKKLQARRTLVGSDGEVTDDDSGIERDSDDEEDGEDVDEDDPLASGSDPDLDSDEAGGDDESNMTSSEDEDDAKSVLSDEGLTQDQLREKYAHLPELDTADAEVDTPITNAEESRAGETTGVDDDTSDESVDMDDDLGSTDMDSDDDDDDDDGSDGDGEESDEEEDGTSGLLGMLFGKSELKKLRDQPMTNGDVESTKASKAVEADDADTPTAKPDDSRPKGNGPEEPESISNNNASGKAQHTSIVEDGVGDTSKPSKGPSTETAADTAGATLTTVAGIEVATRAPEDIRDTPSNKPSMPAVAVAAATISSASQPEFAVLQNLDIDPVVAPEFSPLTTYDEVPPSQLSPETSLFPPELPDQLVAASEVPPDQDLVMADAPPPIEPSPPLPELDVGQPPAADDMPMHDAPPTADSFSVPNVEVTAPPSNAKAASPETDAVTNAISPDPSQSPRTSDTKASEVDTTSSVEPSAAQKEISRSASPLPTAPKTEIPFLLRGTLREYQHYGLDWLAGLYANNTNGILADEMGLGKTIQTIALLAHLACHHEVWGPHLVIVPTSVMLNWEMEFKKWCPGFKILTYYGNQDERKRKRQGWTNDDIWNVCITSYQMVLQDQQVFRRRRWHYMILDEAHNIKNFKSQRWQTLLGFNTHSRLLITGTPLQNNLTELWSLLFFLMPAENGEGGFADLREFHDWFGRPESQILESGREQLDDEARSIITKLHKVLRPYLLRRLKADVEKQMPAKYEHVELCRLSKRQRELYDGFLSRSDTRETLSSGNYLSIINCLMQLRKVCNHPDLFVDRPIMTSFRMQRSVPASFETAEKIVRRRMTPSHPFASVSMKFMNLVPTQHERFSDDFVTSVAQYSSHRALNDLRDAQKVRAQNAFMPLDPSTVESNIIYLESASRWGRFEELQHCVYLNALRRQQKPIYGKRLVQLLTLDVQGRPFKPRPKVPKKIMEWFENDSFLLHNAVQTLERRADSMEMTITKFACVTPAVVTRDLTPFLLGRKGVGSFEEADLRLSAPVKTLPFIPPERPHDPWHEARMRLSIQFPDKRLLQFDCGKLQALDRLLRRLQSGGHRALIFTQMTKVLDILEQFLNIHGHKYLRLDGATKVEQRQILTDRFNHDPRILCFILSTRSGGLGINLTGADTVIFYDQDWNPAMDKQCQDRCHRIGQTRDVHIYRLVSEHTIEANILRKASQKQMLDDVVIQEGEFTTDYFNKISIRDVASGVRGGDGGDGDNDASGGADAALARSLGEGDAAANAAMDRVLGGVETADQRTAGRVLGQAEDREDVDAARVAEKEIQQDDADFNEKPAGGSNALGSGGTGSGVSSTRQGTPQDGTFPASGAGSAVAGPGKSGLGIFSELAGADGEEAGVEEQQEPAVVEYNAWGERMGNIDDYMLKTMAWLLEGTALELPKDKKKSKKKGKDTRKR